MHTQDLLGVSLNIFTPEGHPELGSAYLEPTEFMDYDNPRVRDFAAEATLDLRTRRDQAVALYYAVRDKIAYDFYAIRLERLSFTASYVLEHRASYCVPKAVLLAACARAVGIPAAIGLSDVRNHLSTPKMKERMGGRDLFLHHGYALLYVDGAWLKAAPAFNLELCQRFHVTPTEFDGKSDAVLQEFDANDRLHMQYVRDHGIWSDLPYHRVVEEFYGYYPPAFHNHSTA